MAYGCYFWNTMSNLFKAVSWLSGTNIYEVNVRQYTHEGSFKAFQNHLPRLHNMGVEVLWFMPIGPIGVEKRLGTRGSYYACRDYKGLNPEFGTLEDFKALVAAAHNLGMKVIIDWVANHTAYDHNWTKEHPEWYIKDAEGNFTELNGWNDVIDLDYEQKDMRLEMISAMEYWVKECDIDGFRCDMAHLVPLSFWVEARTHCEAIKPMLWLAECEVIAYHDVFDLTYAWEWMHVTEKFIQGTANLDVLKSLLIRYAAYPAGAKKLWFTTNHDENSWNGTEYEKYKEAAKAFAVFSCTWPGVPLVYSGQELPNMKRLLFFEKDEIEWTGQPLLESFYEALLSVRRQNTALQDGAAFLPLTTNADDKILAYLQVNGNNKLLTIINLSPSTRLQLTIAHEQLSGHYKNIFNGLERILENNTALELQAWEYLVLSTV